MHWWVINIPGADIKRGQVSGTTLSEYVGPVRIVFAPILATMEECSCTGRVCKHELALHAMLLDTHYMQCSCMAGAC